VGKLALRDLLQIYVRCPGPKGTVSTFVLRLSHGTEFRVALVDAIAAATVFKSEERGGALLVPKPREAAEVAADCAAVPCAPGVERGVVAEMRL